MDEESKFVGTWRWGEYNQLIFYANGTGNFNNFLNTWEIENNTLTLYFTDIAGNLSSEYIFSNNDRTLTLFDAYGEAAHYTKIR